MRFLPFIVLALFLFCSPFSKQLAGKLDNNTSTYSNDSLGLQFTFFQNWTVYNSMPAIVEPEQYDIFRKDNCYGLILALTNVKRRAFGQIKVSTNNYDLNEFVKIQADRMSRDSNITIWSANWIPSIQDTAAIIDYTLKTKGDDFNRYMEFYIRNSNRIMVFKFWTLSALFDDYEYNFFDMFKNTKLLAASSYKSPWKECKITDNNSPIKAFLPYAKNLRKESYCTDETHSTCWKVSSASNNVYIMGSIHVAKPELYPLKPTVLDAFKKSKALVVEVNTETEKSKQEIQDYVKRSVYPATENVENHLSSGVVNQLKTNIKNLGMPTISFEQFHPWVLSSFLLELKLKKIGISQEFGIDKYFINEANMGENQKEIIELETAKEQMEMFINFCDNELYLAYTLFGLNQLDKQIVPLISAWKCGNTEALEKFLITDDELNFPESIKINEKMLYERNIKFADKINIMLQDKKDYFVVFGCAHAIGKRGVIEILKKKGYKIEQL